MRIVTEAAFALIASVICLQASAAHAQQVTVHKTPTCGCCTKWEDHLRANGFKVTSEIQQNLNPIKEKHKIPHELASCHTGLVEGYVVEGHVPAKSVRRLLKERPKNIIGLTVPKMPIGSPGMEGPNPEPYEVLAFDAKGKTTVWDRIKP